MDDRQDIGSPNWIDISVPLQTGMVCWPGDPAVHIDRVMDLARGDECNLTELRMGTHTGTHIDAPLHMLAGQASMDDLPLSALIGPARILEIDAAGSIEPDDLARHGIQPGQRILLKTDNSRRDWSRKGFFEDYVALSPDGALFLVQRGVAVVGIDCLSIGEYGPKDAQTHKTLLQAGVWIIEGLDLSTVAAGAYDLICLPLRLLGAEGAPARAVLRARNTADAAAQAARH